MCRFYPIAVAVLLGLAWASPCAWASEPTRGQLDFFEARIRPVLAGKCYECHSAEAKELRGGLRLDLREAMRQGGDSGPAIVPGKPDESLLIEALRHEGFEMPPDGKLPDDVIADFVKWIEMGAPDPRDGQVKVARREIDIEAGKQFWSFRPLLQHAVPEPTNVGWSYTPIDRFILARLEEESLEPAADADRRVLVRRAYFDLIGLPPSPEEIVAFVADDSADAFSRLVDRLLESPHFGERWGRHWLDVARFAESTGGGRSMLFGAAWRYRDYVIASINDDKPYDRFIREQLAGDLLEADDYRQAQEQLVGTAFLALGPTNYELQDKKQLEMDVIDEQIDTMGRAFLGLTLGCARCHDHKFDPVPTADYYALAGIFKSTHTLNHDNVSTWVKRPLPVDQATAKALDEHERKIGEVQAIAGTRQAELDRLRRFFPILTLDDKAAQFEGTWSESNSVRPFVGEAYRYASGDATARYDFTGQIEPGRYEVRVSYTPNPNRTTSALVTVSHAEGETSARIDQTQSPEFDLYTSLGTFEFNSDEPCVVTIGTGGAPHVVIADAVQLIPLEPRETPLPSLGRVVADTAELPGIVVDDTAAEVTGMWTRSTSVSTFVGGGYLHDGSDEQGQRSITFRADLPTSGDYEVRVSYAPGRNRATRVPVNVVFAEGDRTVYVNQREEPLTDGLFTSLGTYRFANDQTAIVTISNEGTDDGHVIADAVQFLPVGPKDVEAKTPSIESGIAALSNDELAALDAAVLRGRMDELEVEVARLKRQVKKLKGSAPPTPPEVIAIEDAAEPADCAVCIRGEIKNLGPVVPRGFVTVATSGDMPALSAGSSGRLELANWIASPENPLTARVMVNRVWHHMFGAGLVRTVDNFGATGERPSHPELLDYLATDFIEGGWSLKSLIRQIMASRVYQLSSRRTEASRAADPENRLLASQNVRRLEAEAIYDSILSLAGTLELTAGGDTIRPDTKSEYGYEFDVGRRAVYLPVFRNRLDDLFAVFDFPDPNLSIGRRTTTTLSTQALYLMNSPLVMDQARSAAQRLLDTAELDDPQRIEMLYNRALGRPPTESERTLAAQFVAGTEQNEDADARLDRWAGLCQAVIACIDFRYLE